MACLSTRNVPFTLIPIILSQMPSLKSVTLPFPQTPALQNTPSILSNRSRVLQSSPFTLDSSLTSVSKKATSWPDFTSSASRACPLSGWFEAQTTRAPLSANKRVDASPIPDVPPVIKIVFPEIVMPSPGQTSEAINSIFKVELRPVLSRTGTWPHLFQSEQGPVPYCPSKQRPVPYYMCPLLHAVFKLKKRPETRKEAWPHFFYGPISSTRLGLVSNYAIEQRPGPSYTLPPPTRAKLRHGPNYTTEQGPGPSYAPLATRFSRTAKARSAMRKKSFSGAYPSTVRQRVILISKEW